MKVAWIGHRDLENPRSGGAERTIYEVGRRLAQRGHEVAILAGAWKGAGAHSEYGRMSVWRVPGELVPHVCIPVLLTCRVHPDVVVEDLAHALPWLVPWFSSTPSTAFFRHLHARTLDGQVSKPVAQVLKHVERAYPRLMAETPFVVESRQSENDLVDLGVPRTKVTRIPPGVESDYFRPGMRATSPLFVYFGGMKYYKRPGHAVAAFAEVASQLPNARLVMIGSGPALGSVVVLARSTSVSDRIVFTGNLSRDALKDLLSTAWVNIHCSVAEGWGYSILEASASGVPTAAYATPGVVDVVRSGVNGLLAPDGDVGGLGNLLVELAASPDKFAKPARRWAEGFSWDTTATAWERHLQSVIAD